MLDVLPQLVANDGLRTLRAAIAEPGRYAIEPKIDGVRGLIVFRPDGIVETRNRRGQVRDWQRHRGFAAGLRRLAQRLPILWDGTVVDTELIADRFAGTMAALQGSAR
jgi:ATP-dependent DNA ligase